MCTICSRDREKYEHGKERNGRLKKKPNGTSRDIPIIKSQQQKLSKMKPEEEKKCEKR